MTWLETSAKVSQMISNAGKSFIEKMGSRIGGRLDSTLGRISNYMSDLLPTYSYETMKNDIWKDMSAIYYKYEIDVQKKAFREIMSEISEKIIESRWDKVYEKLYQAQKNQDFH